VNGLQHVQAKEVRQYVLGEDFVLRRALTEIQELVTER
jgi:hypothetical protein